MADIRFNSGKRMIVNGRLAAGVTTLRACLIYGTKTGITEDMDDVAEIDAVTSVVVGTERITLANVVVTTDMTDNRAEIDCDPFSFAANAGQTALGCLIYDEGGGTDATRVPIGFFDTNFGAGIAMDGGLNVTIPTELFYVS
jgi:hypothetical protein